MGSKRWKISGASIQQVGKEGVAVSVNIYETGS